ncbi:MAG: dihydropteroate synthase [Clostridia bacterium]|nr:dihydropteroate synthase [Clostridia bacterium]
MMFSFKELLQSKKGNPLVMGILNITPDSFSDGGCCFSIESVSLRVKELCDAGADIIDVGACSTAPGNVVVSKGEEIERLKRFLPVVLNTSTVPVSVDTFRPAVARLCLEYGVKIINDESGAFDSGMAQCVNEYGCGWIFMHTGGKTSSETNDYSNGVVTNVLEFFADMRKKASNYSIAEERLCYDCGIGFGKKRQDDLALLSACSRLSDDYRLLVGVSRKRIIGILTGEENPRNRVVGSAAAAAALAQNGVSVLRVHDVKETVDAIKVTQAIKRGIL